MNPILKTVLTVISGILIASPGIPGLSQFAAVLAPLGGLVAGWLHLPQPGAK